MFGVKVGFIDKNLFHNNGKVEAKIDKVAGIIETNGPMQECAVPATLKDGDAL